MRIHVEARVHQLLPGTNMLNTMLRGSPVVALLAGLWGLGCSGSVPPATQKPAPALTGPTKVAVHAHIALRCTGVEAEAPLELDLDADGTAELTLPAGAGDSWSYAFQAPATYTVRCRGGGAEPTPWSASLTVTASFVPQPASVSVQLDPSRAVTKTVSREGGELVATSADGTTSFTLTIPPLALTRETSIALTPLASMQGSPFQGRSLGAVHFAPEGLQLYPPATLTIRQTGTPPSPPVVGFGYRGTGSSFHLVPSTVQGTDVRLAITHFSGAGASEATAQEVEQQLQSVPEVPEDLAEQEDASGTEQAVTSVLGSVFELSVRPALTAALTTMNRADITAALTQYFVWRTQVMRSGERASLTPQVQQGLELAILALKRGYALANGECLATGTWEAAAGIFDWYAETERFGINTPENGLDLATIQKDSCLKVKLEVDLPTQTTGDPMELEVRTGFTIGEGALQYAPPIEIHLNPTGATADPATGISDAAGQFTSTLRPTPDSDDVRVEINACFTGLNLPFCNRLNAVAAGKLGLEVKSRLASQDDTHLGAQTCVPSGQSGVVVATLRMGARPLPERSVTFSLDGDGSLSATDATTNSSGNAVVFYQPPESGEGTATVAATHSSVGQTEQMEHELSYGIQVEVIPAAALLQPGGEADFTARVTCVTDSSVTWTATGGSISPAGHYFAGSEDGRFSVTATSVAAPTYSGSAMVDISRNGTPSGDAGVAPPCGTLGVACCDGRRCDAAFDCQNGICSTPTCGREGLACCNGSVCNEGRCWLGKCEVCGYWSQPCCLGSIHQVACTVAYGTNDLNCDPGTATCERCGWVGQPCCSGHCNGSYCEGGVCALTCGHENEKCCPVPDWWCDLFPDDYYCLNPTAWQPCDSVRDASGATVSFQLCNSGMCERCGNVGQRCCPSPNGGRCSTELGYSSPDSVCVGDSCVSCGRVGEPCCNSSLAWGGCGESNQPSDCAGRSASSHGVCMECGLSGQNCCAFGCQGGLQCMGGQCP
ncbi:MAG: hypothetical protein HY901_22285 [Deltaproteobacteria bacterium]|nr:hypothetical protein [Deltaproteobacteria bacterium]